MTARRYQDIEADGAYRPSCSCGWTGAPDRDPAAARAAWQAHVMSGGCTDAGGVR